MMDSSEQLDLSETKSLNEEENPAGGEILIKVKVEEISDEDEGDEKEGEKSSNIIDKVGIIPPPLDKEDLIIVNKMESGTKKTGVVQNKKLKCINCNGMYDTPHALKNHKCQNICKICDLKFTMKGEWRKHLIKIHGGAAAAAKSDNFKRLSCDFCDAKFTVLEYLKKHVQNRHGEQLGGGKSHVCVKCDKKYWSKKSLCSHIFSQHKEERPLQCLKCPKKFLSPSQLREHDLVHVTGEEKPFFCCNTGCSKKFVNNRSLKIHVALIHNNSSTFLCDYCGETFSAETSLKSHIQRIHTKEFEEFECNYCGKKYMHFKSLKKHILIHHEKRE